MPTLVNNLQAEPAGVKVTADLLTVELSDGRILSVPTEWFPRLAHGTPGEWSNFQLMHWSIHWPDLDEDISIEGLLRGEKSGESPASLQRWLAHRKRGEKVPVPELPLDPKLAKELEKIGVLKPAAARKALRPKQKAIHQ